MGPDRMVSHDRNAPLLDMLEQPVRFPAVGVPPGVGMVLDAPHAPLLDAAPEDLHRVLAPRVHAGARDQPVGVPPGEVGERLVLPLDGHRGLAERHAEVVHEHHRDVDAHLVHPAEQVLALRVPHHREVLLRELLGVQLLLLVAADVDSQMRGQGLPERLGQPFLLQEVVMRVDDDAPAAAIGHGEAHGG